MALIIRKTEGGVRLEGDPPGEHVFSARHIERELIAGTIEVHIHLKLTDGTHVYKLQGFEPDEVPEGEPARSNLSAWVATLEGTA